MITQLDHEELRLIQVLIYYELNYDQLSGALFKDFSDILKSRGLLDYGDLPVGKGYYITAKGRAWLHMLTQTVAPRHSYIDAEGKAIELENRK